MRPLAYLFFLGSACLLHCGGGSTVTLELRNQTSSALTPSNLGGPLTPTGTSRFAMRLVMVYLSEDVTREEHNNTGNTSRIWESPHCDGEADCDYFDFAQGSAAVNAALNAQATSVSPGTYRYVRLEFCHGTPSHPNIEWQATGMAAPHGFISGTCAIDSVKLDPPLVLKAGDHVSVSLGYTMEGATMTGALPENAPSEVHALYDESGSMHAFVDCVKSADGKTATCFNPPKFTPAVN